MIRFLAQRNQASSLLLVVAEIVLICPFLFCLEDEARQHAGKLLLIGGKIAADAAALLPTEGNGARNHFRLVSLCSDMGTSFDLNVKSDSFALASEVIWVSFLRVKTVAKYLC